MTFTLLCALVLLSCAYGDLLLAAMRKADLSLAKACVYLGGDGKPLDQSLVTRQLTAEHPNHFYLDRLDKLPLSVHQWVGPLAIVRFGLPAELEAALPVQMALAFEPTRQMLRMDLRPVENKKEKSA